MSGRKVKMRTTEKKRRGRLQRCPAKGFRFRSPVNETVAPPPPIGRRLHRFRDARRRYRRMLSKMTRVGDISSSSSRWASVKIALVLRSRRSLAMRSSTW